MTNVMKAYRWSSIEGVKGLVFLSQIRAPKYPPSEYEKYTTAKKRTVASGRREMYTHVPIAVMDPTIMPLRRLLPPVRIITKIEIRTPPRR